MGDTWIDMAPALIVAACLATIPGVAVVFAGWRRRRPGLYFLAPAVSIAIIAVAAVAAPIIGLGWSPIPVLCLTVLAAVSAYLIGRRSPDTAPERWTAPAAMIVITAALVAAVLLGWRLATTFGSPQNISQTFDAIVHLNTVAFAIDTSNASALHIGATSDIPFYPNGWHAFTALVATMTGVSVPAAVAVANIAIGAIVWPASCLALTWALLGPRIAALVATAALATGFGAFPLLLLDFGVLYPNTVAYAALPAGVAAAVFAIEARIAPAERVRRGLLAVALAGGIALCHPNALLALMAFFAVIAGRRWIVAAARATDLRVRVTASAGVAALIVTGVALWLFSRTNEEMSRWGPWQTAGQALGEALSGAPRQYPVTIIVCALIVSGLIVVARHPVYVDVALPFAAAVVLFIAAAGVNVDNPIREFLTNPWYNDPYRLAALLPAATIPVASLGAATIAESLGRAIARVRRPATVRPVGALALAAIAFSVAWGPNVTHAAEMARGNYLSTPESRLLDTDEQELLDRLPELVDEDAVIVANPWTGASLAYALAEREVLEKHAYGIRTPDEVYLDGNLADINDDPAVCEAVNRVGAEYVLDFGDRNVFDNPGAGTDHEGLNNLEPGDHLVLVGETGPDARLFRIEGC
jgi:hypothetical protein